MVLREPIHGKEVRVTIFEMESMKTPGVDNIHAIFYSSQWDTVGILGVNFIRQLFKHECWALR